MKKTYKIIKKNNKTFNMLALPGTNYFKFEIISKYGSHIERLYKKRYNKNVFGISHLIEHLSFKHPKDYDSKTLLKLLKNEGTYNASTDYHRINYWFQTTMDRIDLSIKLVANCALNTLKDVSDDEFETEKKVVYNEAKRYGDNAQTMFWFNVTRALTGYEKEDIIIGTPETISTLTKEDCIIVKDMFLSNAERIYNVTYDSTILTENEVIEKIENELQRHKPLGIADKVTQKEYDSFIIEPKNITSKIDNESEQFMTMVNLDVVDNKFTAISGNNYLSTYAEGTSLNDIIREQNGLTYEISFWVEDISRKQYTCFGCDVSKGTEDLMMKLFKESINKSVDNWNDDTYEKYIKTKKLKRTMRLLNQKNYGYWHTIGTWNPELVEEFSDILAKDIDKSYDVIDNKYSSKEAIGEYIEKVRNVVNSGNYGKVTN